MPVLLDGSPSPPPPTTQPAPTTPPPPGGSSAGGGSGGGGGGGGDGAPAPARHAQQHHLQPRETHAPPTGERRYETGRVAPAVRAHPTIALGSVMHHGGGITAPATGASAAPRRKMQAHPTAALIAQTHGRHRIPEPPEDRGTETREREAVSYFSRSLHISEHGRELRLKPFQAAALVGNLAVESRVGNRELISTLQGGIGQWFDGRWDALRASSPRHYEEFRVQLAFAARELLTGGIAGAVPRGTLLRLLESRSIREATAIVEAAYERPGGSQSVHGTDFRRVPRYASVVALLGELHETLLPVIAGTSYGRRLAEAQTVLQDIREP